MYKRQGEGTQGAGSIGILNVDRRLRLADPGCRTRILSREGHFTAVILNIPRALALQEVILREEEREGRA